MKSEIKATIEVDSKGATFIFKVLKGTQEYGMRKIISQEELRDSKTVPIDIAFEYILKQFKEVLGR